MDGGGLVWEVCISEQAMGSLERFLSRGRIIR